MAVISILALPLTLIEYYFTKERISEESYQSVVPEKKIPFRLQLKAVFSDRQMVLMLIYFLIYNAASGLKNIALVYYCNYVLGTYSDGTTQMLISVIGGLPMGIGIFLVWPLAKKMGKRNVTLYGFLLYALGSGICWLAPTNLYVVLAGQFIKNFGGLPCAYIFMALLADVLDHEEWKNGFRVDGCAMSIFSVITTAAVGITTGVFNLTLSKTGYVNPSSSTDGIVNAIQKTIANSDGSLTYIFVQNSAVNNAFIFYFLGLETITGLLCALLLAFIPVEKTIKRKQDEIRVLQKEATEKAGQVWVAPEEKAAADTLLYEKENEEAFEDSLKRKCAKKGLDYQTELTKHLASVSAKKEKAEKKRLAAEEKEKASLAKKEAKHEAKLAAMVSYHLAIDIGASSGRLILSHLEDGHFVLEEVYRFPNGIWRKKEGALWDYDALYSEMIKGFKLCHSLKKDPSTIGVDTWGVDYVLLDENDEPIKPFFAYRDPRGIAASAIAHESLSFEEMYRLTGIQFQGFNTVYQLYDDSLRGRLKKAKDFLMVPEYLSFLLTGRKCHGPRPRAQYGDYPARRER